MKKPKYRIIEVTHNDLHYFIVQKLILGFIWINPCIDDWSDTFESLEEAEEYVNWHISKAKKTIIREYYVK